MRLNNYIIGAFFEMIILSSCGNDDDETPTPKDDSWYWGYFKGTINGKEIAVENVGHGDWPVHIEKTCAAPPYNKTDSIKGKTTIDKNRSEE